MRAINGACANELALFALGMDAQAPPASQVPPFEKGGLGGISETVTQANVAKSPSFPLC
jgi:hypothetical protein